MQGRGPRSRGALEADHVYRPVPAAELLEPLRDGTRGRGRGTACCGFELEAAREQRRERRRVRAAGPVGRRDVVPLDRDLDVALTVEEVVDRLSVPAGH